MESPDAAGLMWRDERRFGWQVGAALIVLGLWRLWMGGRTAATALIAVGAVLTLLGLLAPRVLVVPNRAWMGLAKVMHAIMGPLISGLLYFLLVTPIGWARRTFGRSPLARDPDASSYWMHPHDRDPSATQRFDKPY